MSSSSLPSIDPTTVPGWFNHGPKILDLVECHRPVVCVELGTWLGASAIPVARAVRRWGGTVTCIDTWSGDVRERTTKAPWMLVSCARHMLDAGVGASVRLIPATTRAAAATWTEPIDYLYVDADHSEAACAEDLADWWPHVRPGGLLVGDDYGSALFPGVRRAWDAFADREGLSLTRYQSSPPHADGIALVYCVKRETP